MKRAKHDEAKEFWGLDENAAATAERAANVTMRKGKRPGRAGQSRSRSRSVLSQAEEASQAGSEGELSDWTTASRSNNISSSRNEHCLSGQMQRKSGQRNSGVTVREEMAVEFETDDFLPDCEHAVKGEEEDEEGNRGCCFVTISQMEGAPDAGMHDPEMAREKIFKYLWKNKTMIDSQDVRYPKGEDAVTERPGGMTPEEVWEAWFSYCNRVRSGGRGSDLELLAAARMMERSILVMNRRDKRFMVLAEEHWEQGKDMPLLIRRGKVILRLQLRIAGRRSAGRRRTALQKAPTPGEAAAQKVIAFLQ